MAANIAPPETALATDPAQTATTGERFRDKAANLGHKVIDAVDTGRKGLADRIDGAARGAGQASGAADRAADKLGSMATYVRDNDTRALMAQVGELVRAHPGKSLAAVGAIGYLVGRALRRS
jgi:ElaB/YqjD/DUF883 family membrane-anchored ribosome-binding protein